MRTGRACGSGRWTTCGGSCEALALSAEDVLAFGAREQKRRSSVMDELAAEAQKHGLGY